MTPPDSSGADTPHLTDSETIRVLGERRSIRNFADKDVTDEQVTAILEAARRAPTSANLQAYSVVVVRDPATKEKLAAIAGGQKHIVTCPVYLAFVADLTRIEAAFQRNGNSLDDNNLEMGLMASIDASLVGMSAYVAADSLGIQGVMIGAMRNDPEAVGELLGLPYRAYVVFGMCLGYPAEAPKQKPRMPADGIIHYERYDADKALAVVDIYNAELKTHYESVGKPTADESWSADVDKKYAQRPRDHLRGALKNRGFDFR
ncbi:MAG: NADPH-dependent oxidoreductase [Rhodospirillales bacterium]